MKRLTSIILLLALCSSGLMAQRDFRTHVRSMVHQTIFNTGEIGRALDANASTTTGLPATTSSWEWPPNSYQVLNGIIYWGHQNSFGSGILFGATINGSQVYKACGGITDGSGNATTIAGVYCTPGSITRTENYPVLADGTLNPAYDPNQAEETIVANYTTTDPMKLSITQTSRAWSYPGYDAFIIIEYDIVNTDAIDYTNGFVMFENAIAPSAFALQRYYGLWNESSSTTRSREVYGRYDFSRFMTYVHGRSGYPEPNANLFNKWSEDGDRGGLDGPQAVGFMVLHYDYNNLQTKGQTTYVLSDSARVWDANGKFLQPYVSQQVPNRNVDLSSSRAVSYGLTLTNRSFSAFDFQSNTATPKNDSIYWATYGRPSTQDLATNQALMNFWQGRPKPRALGSGNWTQTTLHYTSFGPYVLAHGQHLRFSVAELVGYGPGVAADTVWRDAGGASASTTQYYEPVPCWYDSLTYPGLSGIAGLSYVGSAYLKNHNLPWYVTGRISRADPTPVISLRDVADRAIQMYTGDTLTKYDGIQFDPQNTPASGVYNTTYIPYPAPQLFVYDALDVKNKLVWGPDVENFTTLASVQPAIAARRIKAGLSHYVVLKSPEGLGAWLPLDSVGIRDPRYFNVDPEYPNKYVYRDTTSLLSENYYYAVISVDSLGGKSGMTNITYHPTQKGAVLKLGGKLYVAPNPLILSSSFGGSTTQGDIKDEIGFYGLPLHCTIRVFSYSGQLVGTIEHNSNTYSNEWFQISRNSQRIASGVYFYIVEDHDDGTRATGKFVIIH